MSPLRINDKKYCENYKKKSKNRDFSLRAGNMERRFAAIFQATVTLYAGSVLNIAQFADYRVSFQIIKERLEILLAFTKKFAKIASFFLQIVDFPKFRYPFHAGKVRL